MHSSRFKVGQRGGRGSRSGDERPVGVRIRKFRPKDLPAIVAIEASTFAFPWTRAAFLSIAYSAWGIRGEVLVAELVEDRAGAERGEEIVGYTCLNWRGGMGHILNLAVSKPFRSRRIGESLLVSALKRFASSGVREVVLEVRRSNAVAINLYTKHGFVVHHVEHSYYPDGEDALVMVKRLDAAKKKP